MPKAPAKNSLPTTAPSPPNEGLSRSWLEDHIQAAKSQPPTLQSARDFAALCVARDFLTGNGGQSSNCAPAPIAPDVFEALVQSPTIEQAEKAVVSAALSVRTPQEKKRVLDAMTWLDIISGRD